MDTPAAVTAASAEEAVALIREQMPQTYKAVQAKAASAGKLAYALVRRALKGEPNCFWACEAGHVVGTPFEGQEISRDVAQLMVQFGTTFVCMWGPAGLEEASGAH